MAVNQSTDLPLIDEGEGDANSQAGAGAAGNQSTSAGSAGGSTGAGAASGTKDGQQNTVPLDKFLELDRQVQRYKDLGLEELARDIEQDPSRRFDIMAAIARRDAALASPEPVKPAAQPTVDPNQLLTQLREVHEKDPVAAQMLIASTVVGDAIKQATAPIAKMAVQSAIDSFKARARGIAYFAKVEGYFDRMVAQVRPSLTGKEPDEIERILSGELTKAFGAGYLTTLQKQQSKGGRVGGDNPPNMGTGGGAGSSAATKAMDKDVADLARWGGLTDQEAADLNAKE